MGVGGPGPAGRGLDRVGRLAGVGLVAGHRRAPAGLGRRAWAPKRCTSRPTARAIVWWLDPLGDERGRWMLTPFEGGAPAAAHARHPRRLADGHLIGAEDAVARGSPTDEEYVVVRRARRRAPARALPPHAAGRRGAGVAAGPRRALGGRLAAVSSATPRTATSCRMAVRVLDADTGDASGRLQRRRRAGAPGRVVARARRRPAGAHPRGRRAPSGRGCGTSSTGDVGADRDRRARRAVPAGLVPGRRRTAAAPRSRGPRRVAARTTSRRGAADGGRAGRRDHHARRPCGPTATVWYRGRERRRRRPGYLDADRRRGRSRSPTRSAPPDGRPFEAVWFTNPRGRPHPGLADPARRRRRRSPRSCPCTAAPSTTTPTPSMPGAWRTQTTGSRCCS